MKNVLLILLLLASLSLPAYGQVDHTSIVGVWNGTLDAGSAKLRLIVTVTEDAAGVYSGKFESVDQGATIPLDAVTLKGDAVRFESKAAGIVFDGILNKERDEIAGTFKQGGQEIKLTLLRGKQAPGTQPAMTPKVTPKPDYSAPADAPYTAEDVLVKTPAGFTLAGTQRCQKAQARHTLSEQS